MPLSKVQIDLSLQQRLHSSHIHSHTHSTTLIHPYLDDKYRNHNNNYIN